MDHHSDIDLLLIGKTGNGKSATGNSILRKKAFKSKSTSGNITKEVDFDVTNFNGKIIKVVDGPGIGDSRMDNKEAEDLVKRTMEYAITANPHGYHAFLLVFRFGGRFTSEDLDTIAFLKTIFGADFVKGFCILVMTCGDWFEVEAEEEEVSFEQWVTQQEGVFKDLVHECCGRVLLFNNRTKDDKKREAQINNLLEVVESLQSKSSRYTDENFSRARETQQKIIFESKKPIIKEKTLVETSLILEKLNQAQKIEDPQSRVDVLKKLIVRVESLAISVQTQDRGTGAMKDLMANVKSIKDSVSGEIRRLEEDCKHGLEKQKKEQGSRQKGAEENADLKQRLGEIENGYHEIKQNYTKGFFDTVVDSVTWPLKNVTLWICG